MEKLRRGGLETRFNRRVPRDFWLEDWEKQAIIAFHLKNPLEGYRRLTFMMLDADIVADYFRLADQPPPMGLPISTFLWLRDNLGRCFDSGYRLANLPVVSVRIDDPSQAPAMLVSDWPHGHGSGGNGLGECGVRVIHNHHHTNGSSAKGFRTEVLMFGRLVRYPKLRSVYRQASHYGSVRCINAIHNLSTKS